MTSAAKANEMNDTSSPLDPQVLGELKQLGDPGFLVDLFKTYLDDAKEKIQTLEDAFANGDAPLVGSTAHTFKGASANISALKLASIAEQLQHLGRASSLVGVRELLDQLNEEFGRVEVAMKQEIAAMT